jgi:hypothetical protein
MFDPVAAIDYATHLATALSDAIAKDIQNKIDKSK